MTRTSKRRQLGGFTLVELLVVIGIIALLISMLLPALNKARSQAIKTACLSNMHQIGIYLQMYGNTYGGSCPIGNSGNDSWSRDFNDGGYVGSQCVMFASSSAHFGPAGNGRIRDWCILGVMFPANIIGPSTGQIFYCPSNDKITDFAYNDTANYNTWPTSLDYLALIPPNGEELYMGYSCRPSRVSYDENNGNYQWTWHWDYLPDAHPNSYGFSASWITASTPGGRHADPRGLPKFSTLNNLAIFSDLDMGDAYTNLLHVDGSNVLYGDGSAHFVPRSDTDPHTDHRGDTGKSYDWYLKKSPLLVDDPNQMTNSDDLFQCWYIFDNAH